VKVIVHGAKATDGDRKDLVQFFESLVDPFFPLETVLIGKQMGLAAASGKAVIPTTCGCVYQSAASFSHRKSPLRNIRFSPQNLPNCKTNAICCACPFCSSPLSAIDVNDSTAIPRRVVSMLWYMPLFMSWQNEQVSESGIDRQSFELAANRIQEQIERILGVP